ncbi:MAG: nucleoside monophosphate kinase [Proteobacteria bacterium]|nr:nucleoside monophosphate kinase [Pseudomonadota bacterium]
MNRIIFLGPPGAGKGTQARIVCARLKIPQISTGDLLRQEIKSGSPLGLELEGMVNAGTLVPDNHILAIISDRVSRDDCRTGYLLDGFPRTTGQALGCQSRGVEVDCVLVLAVVDSIITERLSGRRVHAPSGRTYHISHNPPKVPGKDDETGEDLVQRPDDRPETIHRRLKVYHDQTAELVTFYHSAPRVKVFEIDASADISDVSDRIADCLPA